MKTRILIIEDNPADVFLIREALRAAEIDYVAETCHDGETALRRLAERLVPDLILLDINLPRVDGWHVLDSCRQNGLTAQVPVVILSSSQSPRDKARAAQTSRSVYITKPTELEDFMAIGFKIRQFLADASGPEAETAV